MVTNRYNLTTARGGKDDAAIAAALGPHWTALRAGAKITVSPTSLRRSKKWTGRDRVDICPNDAVFLDRADHTFSPVVVKAAVRVLHGQKFRGVFEIEVSQTTLTITPLVGGGKAPASSPPPGSAAPPARPGGPSPRGAAPVAAPAPAPRPRSPLQGGAAVTPEEACRQIHDALVAKPRRTSPAQVPFKDGLYFFYEEGEVSEHGPNGRIVRVGNHPRSQGGLVRRLRMHCSGNKNSSVFRKFLGGALLRRSNPNDHCLSPGPGKGHWERQDEKTCPRCQPTEAQVSGLLRQRFSFRCVLIPDMAQRNDLEALLVATLAACKACRPSSSWLGQYAYSEKVRASGLWNSQYVGDPTIDELTLGRFLKLVAASP